MARTKAKTKPTMEQISSMSKKELEAYYRSGAEVPNRIIDILRRRMRVSPTTVSEINEELTIRRVVKNKINYLIENFVDVEPYIVFFTIEQLLYGGGLWNQCLNLLTRYGVLNHLGINLNGQFFHPNGYWRPKNRQQLKDIINHGSAVKFPPRGCRTTVRNLVRNCFVNPFLEGEVEGRYRIGPVNGYIYQNNKTGEIYYDESKGMRISGYFIDNPDPDTFEVKQEYLANADLHIKLLWTLFTDRLPISCRKQRANGLKQIQRAEAMEEAFQIEGGRSQYFESISPNVDPTLIEWDRDDAPESDDDF